MKFYYILPFVAFSIFSTMPQTFFFCSISCMSITSYLFNLLYWFFSFSLSHRYTVFDSKQMPQIAQTHAPLLMMSQPPTAMSNMSNIASPSSTTAANNGGIMHNPLSIQQQQHPHMPPQQQQQQLEILSVSSKKLCSYCAHELGSGAAMIIENLGLFYHIDCFKCSVCHTPIADGTDVRGTDVRVRNSRLHCANCFSNEEGIKFSCV